MIGECERVHAETATPDGAPQAKRCPGCQQTKLVSLFYVSRSRPGGRQAYCISCVRARGKQVSCAVCSIVFVQKNQARHCSHACASRVTLTPQLRKAMLKASLATLESDPRRRKGEEQISSKVYRLRSPANILFTGRNINEFVRSNPHLFAPEDLAPSRSCPRNCNASMGLRTLSPHRKHPIGSWKFWTWCSQTERLKNGGADLLNRPEGVEAFAA